MVQGDPDRPLIEQAQSELPYGTRAFDQIVAKHAGPVFRRAYSILRSHSDAEEASQDVFLAVFRNLPRYRFERPFAHWLSVVTLNSCRMILRRRSSEQRRRDAAAREPEPIRGSAPDSALDRDMVLRLLDEVDPGTRIALVMRFVEGFSYAEIGEQLELSQSAVKMRVSRGAKRLRELHESYMAETGKRSLAMAAPELDEELIAEELLRVLRDDAPAPPENLEQRALAKVRATLTSRDLIDLSTMVFVLRFCAPILDLIAAFFGADVTSNDRRDPDE